MRCHEAQELTTVVGSDEPTTNGDADSSAVVLRNQDSALAKLEDNAAGAIRCGTSLATMHFANSVFGSSIPADPDVPGTRGPGWGGRPESP